MIFPYKTGRFLRWMFPELIWSIPNHHKSIYLTFDDGPIPEETPFVLECLKEYNAQASFFCIGDNVRKHPEVFEQVKRAGHLIGNHTYNHLSGWTTNRKAYLDNLELCDQIIGESEYFRPPYGRIKKGQIRDVKAKNKKIVMWDVLTGDFDKNLNSQYCLDNSIRLSESGSIVVFHDSLKASRILRFVLPKYLEHFHNLGFAFRRLDQEC